jgi:hypothetical protein
MIEDTNKLQKPVKPEHHKEHKPIKPDERVELEKPKPTDSAGAGKNTKVDKK